jgi:hypothetical protein
MAKESADLHNLLQELTTKHVDDIGQLDMGPWIVELDRRNIAVQELMRDRYEEQPVTDGLSLRAARLQVDEVYATVADRLDARTILDPDPTLATFIGELNAVIRRAEQLVARRRGRAEAEKEENGIEGYLF